MADEKSFFKYVIRPGQSGFVQLFRGPNEFLRVSGDTGVKNFTQFGFDGPTKVAILVDGAVNVFLDTYRNEPEFDKLLRGIKTIELISFTGNYQGVQMAEAVQYGSSSDFQAASRLSSALGFQLIGPGITPITSNYSTLLVVGAQEANPVYRSFVASGVFRTIRENDTGVQIQVKVVGNTKVVGVAGWSGSDTLLSADYIIQNGIPTGGISIPNAQPQPEEKKPTSYKLDLKVGFIAPVVIPEAQLFQAAVNSIAAYTGTTIKEVNFDGVDTISIIIEENSPLALAIVLVIVGAVALFISQLGGWLKSWELINLSTQQTEQAKINSNLYNDCIKAGGDPAICGQSVADAQSSLPTGQFIAPGTTTTAQQNLFGFDLSQIGNLAGLAIGGLIILELLKKR